MGNSAQALKKKKEEEGNCDICYNVDEPRGHYVTLSAVTERQYCVTPLM